MALSVPRVIYPGLQAIADLDDASTGRLMAVLREAPPSADADRLASEVSTRLGDPAIDSLQQIIRSLVNLSMGQMLGEMSVPQFVTEVTDGLKSSREFRELSDESLTRLRERLDRFLSLGESLAITSKALGVMTDHEHIFMGARILTDVRVVFREEIADPPAGAVIIHMLGVHYHEGQSHKEIVFALDTNDLKELSDSIDRATRKEEALKEMLSRSNVPHLGVK